LKISICKPAFLAIAFAFAFQAGADKVLTQSGKSIEGKIELSDNALKIGGQKIAISEIKLASFDLPPEPPLPDDFSRRTVGMWAIENAGVLCWDGSFIARKVVAVDDTKVTFENSPKELFLSTVNTAAIFFERLSLGHAQKLRSQNKPGVLLATGDFVDGELKHIADGSVVLDSVLFGRKSYALATEAVGLWIRKPRTNAARFTIRTRNGSIILVKKPHIENEAIVLSGSPFKNFHIKKDELAEIQNGAAMDILTSAWTKVDNASPEKKAMLLSTVENTSKIQELSKKIQSNEAKLKEAMEVLAKAETTKADSSVKRQTIHQEWRKLQDKWRQKNREYWKTHSNKLRMNSQVRVKQMAVVRAERALENTKRNFDKHTAKLGILEKSAKANPKKDMRRDRDSLMRTIKRATRDIQKAQKKLDEAKRDNVKIQAETKPLPAQEKNAKQALDQAKKNADQAIANYRKAVREYQISIQQASIARSKVSSLQQEKDQTIEELEQLRSKTPALKPRK